MTTSGPGENSYSIYGNAITHQSGGEYTIALGSGRVRGGFKVELNGNDLMLNVNDHVAPNTTLTWTGSTNGTWMNYDTASPENWYGEVSFDGGYTNEIVKQYLDGDTVRFDDNATGNFAVAVDASGVAPAAVNVDNSAHDYIFSGGAITGTTLTKEGTGTLTLTNANTYSGGTTVNEGTLQIGNDGTTGSITGDIVNNANVTFKRSDNLTYGDDISGTGSVTQAGTGILTLTGTNTYGATTVSAGTLSIGSDANIGAGTNTLNGGALDLNDSAGTYSKDWAVATDSAINAGVGISATLSGVLSGSGGVEKTGAGTLTLTGTNTYGATTVTAGTLSIGSDANIGSGTNTLNGGALDFNTSATYTKAWSVAADSAIHTDTSVSATLQGNLSGTGGITKTGDGTLTLTGTNSYGGATTVTAGTLAGNIAANTDLTLYSGTIYDASGAVRTIGELTGGGSVTSNNTLIVQSGVFAGVISGSGDLTKTGNETLTLTGNNTYSGVTTVSSGTLVGGIANGTALHVASGASYLGTGAARTIGELTGAGYVAGNGSLTVHSGEFTGNIGGDGSIVKAGAGTLILSGTNVYGDTTVTAGTLSIGSDANIGRGTNTLEGGTLKLNTAGTYSKNWTITADSTINNDVAATLAGAFDGSGGIEKTGAGRLTLTGENTYTGVTTVSSGTLQIGNGGTTGSIAGDIVNNTHVTFDRAAALAYDSVISGAGSLTKTGSGTLTFSGANTYTGMTTVEAGKLELTGSGMISNQLTLYGGAEFDAGVTTVPLTRLDIQGGTTPAIYTGNLTFGGTMNFYVPPTATNGDRLLTVQGATFLSNPTVNVGIAGAATPLQTGDQIVLVDSTAPLAGARANSVARATGMQGVTLDYDFDLTQTANQLIATLNTSPTTTEAAKNLSEGYLSGQTMLAQSTDFLLSKGMSAVRRAAATAPGSGGRAEVFAAVGGGRIHHQTGSSVAVSGRSLVTGLATGKKLDAGRVTAAAFFEYGQGDYDSFNSVSGGKVKGSGNTKYQGIGVLAELELSTGLVIEGSLRGGRVETDYRSNDLRDQMTGVRARYDARSDYLSAHIGVGKRWALSETKQLETYAKGIWTRQAGDTTRLSTGETLEFDRIESKRLRIGARIAHAFNPRIHAYAGLALDREFAGEAKATAQGHKIAAPRLKGTSGIGEIGITAMPSPGKPFLIDFGLQGYAGRREGVTGSLRAQYYF